MGSGMQITPESGFEDFSGSSVEPSTSFPSVPQSLLGSRNISLIALQPTDTHTTIGMAGNDIHEDVHAHMNTGVEIRDQKSKSKMQGPIGTKLPEIIKPSVHSNSSHTLREGQSLP